MAAEAETEIDTDPTGMYAMARRTHENAVRNGLVKTWRRRRTEEVSEEIVFAEIPPTPLTRVGAVRDDSYDMVVTPNGQTIALPRSKPANGWVPTRPPGLEPPTPLPAIERRAMSITELDAAPPPSAARVFPTLESPADRTRTLWPGQTSPVFEEVDAEVTWPRTPTGRKAKRGPVLPITDGLPYEEYQKAVATDFQRVLFEQRLLEFVLDEHAGRA